MIRKILTILSLIGLVLSVGLWALSYFILFGYASRPKQTQWLVYLRDRGCEIRYCELSEALFPMPPYTVWHRYTRSQRQVNRTDWKPCIRRTKSGMVIFIVPFWLPTALFGTLFCVVGMPYHRRRKRKKLGLCLKCGYDLRASKDRCPECGEEFGSTNP